MKLLFGLLVCALGYGQTVVDLLSLQKLVTTSGTQSVIVTAAQGDGGNCSITKSNGGAISGVFACSSADGKSSIKTATFRNNGNTTTTFPIGLGDVFCLIGVNSTNAGVSMGSLGLVPANSIMWNCSTNIRDGAGNIIGQTAIVAGSTTWP